MDSHSDNSTTPLGSTDDREAWRSLIRYLLEHIPAARPPESIDALVDRLLRRHPGQDRSSRAAALEDLSLQLGLSLTWRTARAQEVGARVVPDEVAVCWADQGWVAVRRPMLRRRMDHGPWGRVPDGLAAWACLASSSPASALAAGHDASPWRRLQRLLNAERRDVGLVIAYGAGSALLALATPVTVQILVNTIAFGAFRQPLLALALLLFCSLALAAFLSVLQRILVETLQRRLLARVTDDLADRLPRVRLSTWDQASGPEKVNRFFDVITIQKSLATLMVDGLGAVVSAAVGLSLLAVYHPALLGFDILLILGAAVVLFGFGIGGPEAAIIESKRKYALAEWLELLSDRPDLFKHDGAGALAAERTSTATRSWLEARDAHFRIFIRQFAGAWGLQAIATTALLGIGGWLVFEGQLTLGQLVAAEIVVASALSGMVRFTGKLETFYDLLAAVDKVGHLLDLPVDPQGTMTRDTFDHPIGIGLYKVTLPRHDEPVSFHLAPGAAVRVGVADLLARRHLADMLVLARDPASGRVQVDDVDLCDSPRARLQDRVALVRDVRPLPVTVRENLALGREDVDDDTLREVLDAVGLGELTRRLPNGLDTLLVGDDERLSPDERVRLAVARAMAGQPRLLVLDNPLHHAEPATRARLLDALTMEGRAWTLVSLDDLDDDIHPTPLDDGSTHRAA